jgi:hypothetical protein
MSGDEMFDPAGHDASDTLDGEPDKWSRGEGFGTTAEEEQEGESLDQLLAEEEPEADPYADEGEPAPAAGLDDSEPDPRAGRLVADDEGAHVDQEPDLVAHDVGIDAGGAGAEEAAVHVEDDDDEDSEL